MKTKLTFSQLPRARAALVVLAVIAALAAPTVALAGHDFGDVPGSDPSHAAISEVHRAGMMGGCGGGDFCPDRRVTRAEVAEILARSVSRVASSVEVLDSSIVVSDGWVTIASVRMRVPGLPGGAQHVVVRGEVSALTDLSGLNGCGAGAAARCYVVARLRDATGGLSTSTSHYAYPQDIPHQDLVSRQGTLLVDSGIRVFQLQVRLVDGVDALQLSNASLIVTTHPLDANAPLK